MAVPFRNEDSKRKYAKISLKKRQTLVQQVIHQGCGLTKTAKKLNLKLSTAKLILRKYKQTGMFHIRRVRKSPVENVEALPVIEQQLVGNYSEACDQKQVLEGVQLAQFPTNLYGMMYSEGYYPYFGYYGVWPVDNYYQFI